MHSASKLNRVFGKQLRIARRDVHLTQEQLAYCAQLDRTYISLLERGRKSPTLITLFQLCRALNLPPETWLARVHQHLVQRELNHPTKDQ